MDSPTVLTHNTKLLLPLFTISHYLPGSKATGNQFRYSFLCFPLNDFRAVLVSIVPNFILCHDGELGTYMGIYCKFIEAICILLYRQQHSAQYQNGYWLRQWYQKYRIRGHLYRRCAAVGAAATLCLAFTQIILAQIRCCDIVNTLASSTN